MINFVNGTPQRIIEAHGDEFLHVAGVLTSPRSRNNVVIAAKMGMPWAMDNNCFTEYNPVAIVRTLHRFCGVAGCKFAVVPDVVCNHDATLLMFRAWVGTYQRLGYPVAFVLQNGVSVDTIPWGSIDAIFIGGDTAFKYSQTVLDIVQRAKRNTKWVHMGRVNSIPRLLYAKFIGCDSFDGTGYSIAPYKYIRPHRYVYGSQLPLFNVND